MIFIHQSKKQSFIKPKFLNNQSYLPCVSRQGRDKLHAKFTFFTVDANETFQIDCVDNGKSQFLSQLHVSVENC